MTVISDDQRPAWGPMRYLLVREAQIAFMSILCCSYIVLRTYLVCSLQ